MGKLRPNGWNIYGKKGVMPEKRRTSILSGGLMPLPEMELQRMAVGLWKDFYTGSKKDKTKRRRDRTKEFLKTERQRDREHRSIDFSLLGARNSFRGTGKNENRGTEGKRGFTQISQKKTRIYADPTLG